MHRTTERCRKALALALAASLILPGCSTPARDDGYEQRTGNLTPAERNLRRQSSSLTSTNTQACIAGGALVGMTMLLLSQGRRDANRRALAGAIAGCGVGVGVNSYVQDRRQQYADGEQRLQSMVSDVRRDNARVARLIATSEDVIATDKRRISEADRAYADKEISLAQARRELEAVKDNRNHLAQTLAALNRKEREWMRISNYERRLGSNTNTLDAEIERLQKQISGLEEELRLIDQRIRVSPISA